MRPGVEARGFQVFAHVGDDRGRFVRQRDRRMLDDPIDVVDAEADPFQVERGDGAVERFGFLESRVS